MGMANDDIALFDSPQDARYRTLGDTTALGLQAALSADGSTALFLAALWGKVGALDTATGSLAQPWPTDEEYYPEAFTLAPDGKTVITRYRGLEFRRFTVSKGRPVGEPNGGTRLIAISWDSQNALWADDESRDTRLADPTSDAEPRFLANSAVAELAAFADDGKTVWIAWADGTVTGVDTLSLDTTSTWSAQAHVTALAPSSDGKFLLIARAPNPVFMANTDEETEKLVTQVGGTVIKIALSHDASKALFLDDKGQVLYWDIPAAKKLWSFNVVGPVAADIALPAHLPKALVASDDGTVRYVDLQTGQPVAMAKFFEEGSWFIGTREGFYDGSKGCERYYALRQSGPVIPLADQAKNLRNPQKVQSVLLGR